MSDLKCKSCQGWLFRIGSFYACDKQQCERFAVPVDYRGMTDEEAQIDAVRGMVSDEGAESEAEMQADGMREIL